MLTLLFSCSIISDDYLKELPEKVKLTKISASGYDYYGTETKSVGKVSYPNSNKVVVDWSGDLDLFYSAEPVSRITYDLNAAGFATTISVLFTDGALAIDELTYNASNQVTEMNISSPHTHYKFFYKDNVIDSVTQETNFNDGYEELFGFYKSMPGQDGHKRMISIYPFDKEQPFTMDEPVTFSCGDELQLSHNESSKSLYYYEFDIGDKSIITPITFTLWYYKDHKMNKSHFGIPSEIQFNTFGQISSENRTWTSEECPTIQYGLNNFSVMPTLFPDAKLLQLLTITDEFTYLYLYPSGLDILTNLDLAYEYEY